MATKRDDQPSTPSNSMDEKFVRFQARRDDVERVTDFYSSRAVVVVTGLVLLAVFGYLVFSAIRG